MEYQYQEVGCVAAHNMELLNPFSRSFNNSMPHLHHNSFEMLGQSSRKLIRIQSLKVISSQVFCVSIF